VEQKVDRNHVALVLTPEQIVQVIGAIDRGGPPIPATLRHAGPNQKRVEALYAGRDMLQASLFTKWCDFWQQVPYLPPWRLEKINGEWRAIFEPVKQP